MKRELKAENGAALKGSAPTKSAEREFAQMMTAMVSAMSEQFKNQTLKELNKGTVDKFADSAVLLAIDYGFGVSVEHNGEILTFNDAQIGNYASVFLKLSKKVKRKLLKRFDDDRIENLVKAQLGKVDKRGKEKLYKQVEDQLGISTKELVQTEGLKANTNALMLETAQWAKRLRDEHLEDMVASTLRGMAEGQSLEEINSRFDDLVEKRKGNAKMVARTQINTFNSLSSKVRAQNLGIARGVWRTAKDERVRTCHKVRDGKEFDLSEGLYSSCDGKHLQTGVDYNCRCTTEYLIPED